MEEDKLEKNENHNSVEVEEKPEVKTAIREVISATYKGPLPPPNIMRGYDDYVLVQLK